MDKKITKIKELAKQVQNHKGYNGLVKSTNLEDTMFLVLLTQLLAVIDVLDGDD